MNVKFAQAAALIAAILTTGLTAGLFFTFSVAVMPALAASSDKTYVEAMRKINIAIINPLFLTCFLGALVLGLLALVLHIPKDGRQALPWIIAGVVCYSAVIMITGGANIPLNNELEKLGAAGDIAGARQHFENAWVAWNIVRTVFNIAAFGCLAWALILHGRGEPDSRALPGPLTATAQHQYQPTV
jgi:uncharacterized membrane protein